MSSKTLKKIKTVLINPPLSAHEQAGALEEVENVMPPLGIGYIASVLEQNNFDVKIIDCRVLNIMFEDLVKILKSMKPDVIGVTATVLEIQKSIKFAEVIKKELPDSLLVLGGPHLTSSPLKTLEQSAFDIGVIAEGEYTLLEIVQKLSESKTGKLTSSELKDIKGIVYKDKSHIKLTPPRPYIKDLDSLPFPARHLYPPLSKYRPVPASYTKLPLGHIITSRGCPGQCIFCDRKIFGNVFRARSPKNVADEIEQLIKVYKAKEIKFFDDTFTVNKKRVMEILAELKKRNLKFPWSCLTRVNCVDFELLKAMKEAGCWQIAYGLESGDQRMLDIMKKGITVEQNRNAVVWAKKAGINVRAFFVLGMPGETLESINKTIDFAKSLPIDVATFYMLTLYPGNELYDMVKEKGAILHEDYSQYNPLIDVNQTKLAYVPEGLTESQIKNLVSKAYKEFYFRPGYIIRQALSIRRWDQVVRYWRGFKAVLNL